MWSRVKDGLRDALGRTTQSVQKGWASLFQADSLHTVDWDALEETLLAADVGTAMTDNFLKTVRQYTGDMRDIRQHLIGHMTAFMVPFEGKLSPSPVVLFVGVNGSGKTTTIGKLGALWHDQGEKVRLIAGDTFRAAATEQLAVWAKNIPITTGEGDPASVVYQGLVKAKENQDSVVLIDTAGRLPHQVGLMDQLKKIYGVIQRLRPEEHCEVILTLDATVGQHAVTQLEHFQKVLPISGIIMNKMDGTAKGGVLLQISQRYHLPIYAVGVGESQQDLQPFSAASYALALWGAA